MPWWLPIYVLVVVTVSVLAIRDDYGSEPPLMTAAEVVSTALLLFSGLAYWLEPLRDFMGTAAPYVFVAALSWVAVSAYREIKRLEPNPELTARQNNAAVAIGISLFVLLHIPLVYWGYRYAYQGLHNGA